MTNLLTLGRLPFDRVYGLAIWLHYLLLVLGVFALGRRIGGVRGGLAAALLVLFDYGDTGIGTWKWDVQWGVWPQFLSIGLALFALARLNDALLDRTVSAIAWCALLVGAAVLSHPVSQLFIAPAALAFALVYGFKDARVGRALLIAGCCLGLGFAIGATWSLPFSRVTNVVLPLAELADNAENQIVSVFRGQLFGTSFAWLTSLGAIGIFLSFVVRAPAARGMGLATILLGLLLSTEGRLALRIEDLSPQFSWVQWYRLLASDKVCWALMAGFAVSFVARRHDRPSSEPSEWRRRSIVIGLVGMLVAPLVPGLARSVDREWSRLTISGLPETPTDGEQFASLLSWFRTEIHDREFVKGPFFRVLFMGPDVEVGPLAVRAGLHRRVAGAQTGLHAGRAIQHPHRLDGAGLAAGLERQIHRQHGRSGRAGRPGSRPRLRPFSRVLGQKLEPTTRGDFQRRRRDRQHGRRRRRDSRRRSPRHAGHARAAGGRIFSVVARPTWRAIRRHRPGADVAGRPHGLDGIRRARGRNDPAVRTAGDSMAGRRDLAVGPGDDWAAAPRCLFTARLCLCARSRAGTLRRRRSVARAGRGCLFSRRPAVGSRPGGAALFPLGSGVRFFAITRPAPSRRSWARESSPRRPSA